MIQLIVRETLDKFPLLIPGLSRALSVGNLSANWSLDTLYQHIINHEAYGFYQEESGYAGVFVVSTSPLCKSLYFFWSGKDPENKKLIDYKEVDEFLTIAAKALGCRYILCEGRKGWKKTLSTLGYAEDSVVFSKEIPDESIPIS